MQNKIRKMLFRGACNENLKKRWKRIKGTYDGMSGAGRACPVGRPPGTGGAAPPGRFGIAGAGRPVAGGGGPRAAPPPWLPMELCLKEKQFEETSKENQKKIPTCCCGAAFLGPPGLGGESLGLSGVGNQSFLTGGGTGVENVAIETSPD